MKRLNTRNLIFAGLIAVGIGLVIERGIRAQPANEAKGVEAKKINLEGRWKVVELTRSDLAARVFPTEDVTGMVDFQEDTLRFTVTSNGKSETRMLASYSLDQALNSGAIDVTFIGGPNHGKVASGIFELNENELRICLPIGPPWDQRPTEFKAETDTNRQLFVLRRLEQ